MSLSRNSTFTGLMRRGTITILAAVCLVVVVVFLAFSVDYGNIVVVESELQNGADAAALVAARTLPDRDTAVNVASQWAAKHTAAGKAILVLPSDVEIGLWDDDTAVFSPLPADSALSPNAIKVSCKRDIARGNALNLFFGAFLGAKQANLAATAIAKNHGSSCGSIMALEKVYLNDRNVGRASYADSYDSSKGDYYSQTPRDHGDICTNGHLTLNGNSYVNGDARWWEGANDPNADASQVSGDFESFVDWIDFPPIDAGNAKTINDNNKILSSDSGDVVFPTGHDFVLGTVKYDKKKKVYMSQSAGKTDSLTLQPGIYYFDTMTISSGSRLNISGPTYIYVNGTVDLRWGAIDNQTKKPMNLQIYPMGVDSYLYLPFFGQLHAVIYSTVAHIYLDEKDQPVNLEFFGKMVGQKIRVFDTALHVDESVSFGNLKSGGEQIGKTGISLVQ